MIFLGIWLGINVLAALVFLLTGIGCLRPNRRPGYCRRPGCGHAEEDHETEEDNGFCFGGPVSFGSIPRREDPAACRCRRFVP